MGNYIIPNIPVLATQLNDTDLFEKADGPASGQSQRVTALVAKAYMQSGLVIQNQTVALDGSTLVYQAAHGLGHTPKFGRAVLVCITNDAGTAFVVGQEIDAFRFQFFNSSNFPSSVFYSDGTSVYLAVPQAFVGNENHYLITRSTGSAQVNPSSFNNFQLKFYYA
jgi:hypothetical protein